MYRKSPSSTVRVLAIFLLMLMAPYAGLVPESVSSLEFEESKSFSITFSEGSGDELIGDTLTLNNSDWTVRSERGFDEWISNFIENGSAQTSGKMLIEDDLGRLHGCWSEGTNGIWMFKTEADGNVTTQQVDNQSALDGCALAIDDQDNLFITWADSQGELHLSREAKKGAMNFARTFLTRALIENSVQLPLNIDFSDGMRATIVWRSANDSTLWATNHTGSYWMTRQLISDAVGSDIEMIADSDGVMNVAYTQGNDVRLLRFNETIHDDKVLYRSDSSMLNSRLGFNLDSQGNPQISYEGDDGVMILRSLSGQSTGRVNPDPMANLSLEDMDHDSPPTIISHADFDADGTSDLVVGNPSFDNGSGSVVVHFGNKNRSAFLDPATVWSLDGSVNESLSSGLAAGDFNGDGFDDLVVGIPGRGNNSSNVGHVELYLGSSSGLTSTPAWVWTLNASQGFTGAKLASAGDVDSDGDEELLIVSSNYTSPNPNSEKGRADMFLGGQSMGQVPDWTLNGTAIDSILGASIAGGGDVNGDGYDDFAISSTGTKDNPVGFSAIEIFFGSASGISMQADQRLDSNIQGKLLGYHMDWVDLDGNGNDELLVGEPFNGSAYQSGLIWIFNGTDAGLDFPTPLTTLSSTQSNDQIGSYFSSAGDINEDGYEDLLISRRGLGKIGSLSLYLGSEFGILTTYQSIAQGAEQGDMMAVAFSTGGDCDDDGMSEIMILEFDDISSGGDGWIDVLTERDWSTTSLGYQGISILDIQIGSSFSGIPNIMIDSQPPILLQYMDDGTPEGYWLERSFSGFYSPSMVTSASGVVNMLVHDDQGQVLLLDYSSRQLVEQNTITTGNIGAWVDIEIDGLGHPSMVHARVDTSELYWTRAGASGWSTSLVTSGVDLDAPITHMIDDSNDKWVVYRDSTDSSLSTSYLPLNSWITTTLVPAGSAKSDGHAATILSNGSLAVISVVDVSGSDSLNLTILNGSELSTESLNASPNRDAHFQLLESSGMLYAVWQNNTDGECVGMSRALNGSNWTRDWSWFANTSIGAPLIIKDADSSPHVLCSGGALGADGRLVNLSDSTMVPFTLDSDGSSIRSYYDVAGGTYLIRDTSADGGSISLLSENSDFPVRVRTPISGEVVNHADLTMSTDGVIHLAFQDNTGLDLVLMKLLPDADADRIPDTLDGMPNVSGQWEDSDGDGFGDNPDGPGYDDCSGTAGTSIISAVGCLDYDGDMIVYTDDRCLSEKGYSYFDRLGCPDYDRDGWSNNDQNWISGDQYPFNWKQTKDTDGDSRGDNSGPDCCDSYWPDTNYTESHPPDIFPLNKHQWKDSDGDGFGDNYTHSSGDNCLDEYGLSSEDRNGCPDSDGDGYSDPGDYGGGTWDVENGADAFVNDSTQWEDSDGDGYGDNSEPGTNIPDHWPSNPAAANDTDDDGFPDNWTAQFTGNNSGGLVLDACPDTWGNATEDMPGCPDRDGDGVSDLNDPFPEDSTQWADQDGDGWGDNPSGNDPDACPTQAGIANGTGGDGCPIVVAEDEDGDGVIDDFDNCSSTPQGEEVDSEGCSESQKDDDGDGVSNSQDDCPDTPQGEVVDLRGCTEIQQDTDTDGDGVVDPDDNCSSTPLGEVADLEGCSESQKDDDEDGVSNDLDQCPETMLGATVDEFGCVAAGVDTDGDGIEDLYDILPADPSQWEDADGDGFGDNMSGTDGDQCLGLYGNSTFDRKGCLDSDGDGYSDPTPSWTVFDGADAFAEDSSQWKDSDKDGYGDNSSAEGGDQCPNTPAGWRTSVLTNGCAPVENDADADGIFDLEDQCPGTLPGVSVNSVGCKIASDSTESESTSSGGTEILIYSGAGVGILVLLIIIISLIRGGGEEDDDDDDDWFYDDDDDDDDYLAPLQRSSPQRSPARTPARAGPGPGAPVGGTPGGPSRGPPSQRSFDPYAGGGYGSPPPTTGGYGYGGPAPRAPVRSPPPGQSPATPRKKSVKKKVVNVEEEPVEEEIQQQNWQPEDEGPLFDAADEASRQDSVAWAWDEIQFGKDDRNILMGLQGSGWSARQSRAILEEARAW